MIAKFTAIITLTNIEMKQELCPYIINGFVIQIYNNLVYV